VLRNDRVELLLRVVRNDEHCEQPEDDAHRYARDGRRTGHGAGRQAAGGGPDEAIHDRPGQHPDQRQGVMPQLDGRDPPDVVDRVERYDGGQSQQEEDEESLPLECLVERLHDRVFLDEAATDPIPQQVPADQKAGCNNVYETRCASSQKRPRIVRGRLFRKYHTRSGARANKKRDGASSPRDRTQARSHEHDNRGQRDARPEADGPAEDESAHRGEDGSRHEHDGRDEVHAHECEHPGD